MAPEVIVGMKYDYKADVFSFGMLMAEVITRYGDDGGDGDAVG